MTIPITNIKQLKEEDLKWKGSLQYDMDGIKRAELYEDRSRELTRKHLETLGVGDPANMYPTEVGLLARTIEEIAVAYDTPVTRTLKRGKQLLPHDSEHVEALSQVLERMDYDLHWQVVDEMKTLYRNVVMMFAESVAHRCTQIRIFEPFNVFRKPRASAPDILDADQEVAFQIRGDHLNTANLNLYHVWKNAGSVDDPDWRMWIVDESGFLAAGEEQPYGEEGITPFNGILPALLIHDEAPRGRAYLRGGESRVSAALNVNALVNDLNKLVKDQAHSQIVSQGKDHRGAPKKMGPDVVWEVPEDHKVTGIPYVNPKIVESSMIMDLNLRVHAISEGLAADRYLKDRQIPGSSKALKVMSQPMKRRRNRQIGLAHGYEARAYEKMRVVHNAFALSYGLPKLDTKLSLVISVSKHDDFSDPLEHQKVSFGDMAAGYKSPVEYTQEKRGCSRAHAEEYLQLAKEDLEKYPPKQNPGSMIDGENLAGGEGSATRTSGAFHPDQASGVEGASTLAALQAVGGSNSQ